MPNRRLFTLAQIAWPQTGACLLLRRLRGLKQAPVCLRADCRTSNRRLFTLAQIAWRQTGACLLSRRLRSLKQALVYPRANCVASNRRLFTLAQIAGPQTGACLLSRRLQDAKQAPVYSRAGLCRGRAVYSGTRPNFPTPVGILFSFAQASAEAGQFILVPGQTSQPR